MIVNYSDKEVIMGQKSIFLAGPTPRSESVKSWRIEACEILDKLGYDGVVYVPEYSTWTPKRNYDDQAEWERIALTASTVILFWIPRTLPDMPAFTTNVEFGYWIHTGKIIYGRPDDSRKNDYLDWLYKKDTSREPIANLNVLLDEAMRLSEQLYDDSTKEIVPLEERVIFRKVKEKDS